MISSNPAHPVGCGNVEVVDVVDVVDVDVPAVVAGAVAARGSVVEVGAVRRMVVVVLASARSPVTSDGSGGIGGPRRCARRATQDSDGHNRPAQGAHRVHDDI